VGAESDEISFFLLETKKTTLFTKNVAEKCRISKSRDPLGHPCCPPDAHALFKLQTRLSCLFALRAGKRRKRFFLKASTCSCLFSMLAKPWRIFKKVFLWLGDYSIIIIANGLARKLEQQTKSWRNAGQTNIVCLLQSRLRYKMMSVSNSEPELFSLHTNSSLCGHSSTEWC